MLLPVMLAVAVAIFLLAVLAVRVWGLTAPAPNRRRSPRRPRGPTRHR